MLPWHEPDRVGLGRKAARKADPKRDGDRMRAIMPNDRARIKLEVQKEVEAFFNRKSMDYDTYVFWILHKSFGFGPVRLRRFFKEYITEIRKEQNTYRDLTAEKMREALKHNIGVDVEAWEKEV